MAELWEDHSVVVTGGTGLVGKAMARAFLDANAAHVAVVGSTEARTAAAAEALAAYGERARAIMADVSNEAEVESLFADVEAGGGPAAILVNGAGINHNAPISAISADDFDRVIGVNLKAAFLCGKRACEAMKAAGIPGRVINIASGNYRYVRPGSALYSASKAGLDLLSRGFAEEYGAAGITANSVAPGLILDPENDDAFYAGVAEYYRRMSPLKRVTDPADVADIVLFLASNKARAVTGEIIVADGGFSTGRLDFPSRSKQAETAHV